MLALFVAQPMQHLNGIKILLAGLANSFAAVTYAFLAPVEWRYVACLMVASLFGGHLGASMARRIPGETLRIGIALVGLTAAGGLTVGTFV